MATKKAKTTKAEIIEQSETATLVATEATTEEIVIDEELKADDLTGLETSKVSEAEFIEQQAEEAAKEEAPIKEEAPKAEYNDTDLVLFRNKSGHLRHGYFGKISRLGYEAISLYKK